MTRLLRLPILAAAVAVSLFATPARSEMQIAEAPILTLVNAADSHETAFTLGELEAQEQHTIQTTTSWTEGVQTFEGPLVRDVLAKVAENGDAKADIVRAVALNDYAVEIPIGDFDRYPVILALRHNGKPMSVRDKGPIWIVYPRDAFPELMSAEHNAKWIWQLARIELR